MNWCIRKTNVKLEEFSCTVYCTGMSGAAIAIKVNGCDKKVQIFIITDTTYTPFMLRSEFK